MFKPSCKLLSLYLIASLAILGVYTLVVGQNHGWSLIPLFFQAIAEQHWQGQFNMDFTGFLGLSALWVMWRNGFTSGARVLGIVAFFGGMLFLATYLLVLARHHKGDIEAILLGRHNRRQPIDPFIADRHEQT